MAPPSVPEDRDPVLRANTWLNYMRGQEENELFDTSFAKHLSIVSVSDKPVFKTTFSFTVSQNHCNGMLSLHGGAVATLFDLCTSITIYMASREGHWDGGHVSRSLNCTYIRPAMAGDELLVESEVVSLGKRMGLVKGIIRKKKDGKVLYTCDHDKAAVVLDESKL